MGMEKFKNMMRSGAIAFLLALFTTHAAYASAQKGIQAFQHGKYKETLRYLQPAAEAVDAVATVSYTHLTLPTIYSV